MIIQVLVENTTINKNFKCEHGLSLFIQTKNHTILFDMGETSLFAENAKKMNVDLKTVDIAFISHGHYDHGGGLKKFLQINSKAKIFLHPKAFDNYYAIRSSGEIKYIGLDKQLKNNKRLVFTEKYYKIDDELEIFSDVKQRKLNPHFNKVLYMECGGEKVVDSFTHEQNLIITTENKTILVAGCAHNGIVNIMQRYFEIKGAYPDYVIGGFHLFNPSNGQTEKREFVEEIAKELTNGKTHYYTGHCTGKDTYLILKEKMQANIDNLTTAKTINI